MAMNFSKELCIYVITKEQNDLFAVFENFSDKISNPEDNIFFIQNEILDRILTNVEECNKPVINNADLYRYINKKDKDNISSIDLDKKLMHNAKYSHIIGVRYFNEEIFKEVLDEKLEKISTSYNLNAQDDYNKIYMFLSSIQLNLDSSDDSLVALANQYNFFKEHYNKQSQDEYISIYGEKHYKIDILKELIEEYNDKLPKLKENKKTKKSKGTR